MWQTVLFVWVLSHQELCFSSLHSVCETLRHLYCFFPDTSLSFCGFSSSLSTWKLRFCVGVRVWCWARAILQFGSENCIGAISLKTIMRSQCLQKMSIVFLMLHVNADWFGQSLRDVWVLLQLASQVRNFCFFFNPRSVGKSWCSSWVIRIYFVQCYSVFRSFTFDVFQKQVHGLDGGWNAHGIIGIYEFIEIGYTYPARDEFLSVANMYVVQQGRHDDQKQVWR